MILTFKDHRLPNVRLPTDLSFGIMHEEWTSPEGNNFFIKINAPEGKALILLYKEKNIEDVVLFRDLLYELHKDPNVRVEIPEFFKIPHET